ncbi:MAG: DNA repair protein RadC [Myxococcota bacterium]
MSVFNPDRGRRGQVPLSRLPELKSRVQDGPRERLERLGPESLSDAELTALLIRTGTRDHDALSLSCRLLASAGGLVGLAELSLGQLTAQPGLGVAKSASLLAAREFGRRMAGRRLQRGATIRGPEDIHRHFDHRMRHRRQEHFMVLMLDGRHRVMRESQVSQGTLNASLVHPREVFRSAVRESAAALVLVHNHPSGDPTPSGEDFEVTRRLVEAGELLGIRVVDHVVVAERGFYSFREHGELGGSA